MARRNLKASAQAALLVGDLDRAVRLLEEAIAASPEDATAWSDLAAIQLELARRNSNPENLLVALILSEKAKELAPSMEEAHFNQALILAEVGLLQEARERWAQFIQLEKEIAWRQEAIRRRNSLNIQAEGQRWRSALPVLKSAVVRRERWKINEIVGEFRLSARRFGEEEALRVWATSARAGQYRQAAEYLQQAEAIGEALVHLTGDAMLVEVTSVIRGTGEPDELAEGHIYYSSGIRHYDKHEVELAKPALEKAYAKFKFFNSPLALWALFFIAACEYQKHNYHTASELLDQLDNDLVKGNYPNLQGRVAWLRGLMLLIGSKYDKAFMYYEVALARFMKTGELDHIAVIRYLRFEYFYFTGDAESAWRELCAALLLLKRVANARFSQLILYGATAFALSREEPSVALLFQNQAVRLAIQLGDQIGVIESLRWRAQIYKQSGNFADARRDVDSALKKLTAVSQPDVRLGLTGGLRLIEGQLREEVNPGTGLVLIGEAISILERTQHKVELLEAYQTQAHALLLRARLDEAEKILRRGIEELEVQWSGMSRENRIGLWERAQGLFDEMILLQLESQRPDIAYFYSERAKARTLLDRVEGGRSQPKNRFELYTVETVESALPHHASLIQFTVLHEEIVIWFFRSGSFNSSRLKVKREDLSRIVKNLWRCVQQENGSCTDKLTVQLYSLLFGKLPLARLGHATSLIIIPDKVLGFVPFAALRSPLTGKFLVEDYRIEISPSASIYLHCLRQTRKKPLPSEPRVLLVSNPAFDRRLMPNFGTLRLARDEALKLNEMYGEIRLLEDEEATKSAVLYELSRSDIAQFSTHAIMNYDFPAFSKLVLAGDRFKPEQGFWHAHEIYSDSLEVHLVILPNCKTAQGPVSAADSVMSLARAFIAAGAPSVIGSLWDIGDGEAVHFNLLFHQSLRARKPLAEAVRQAQIAMARAQDPKIRSLRSWAGFQLLGAGGD